MFKPFAIIFSPLLLVSIKFNSLTSTITFIWSTAIKWTSLFQTCICLYSKPNSLFFFFLVLSCPCAARKLSAIKMNSWHIISFETLTDNPDVLSITWLTILSQVLVSSFHPVHTPQSLLTVLYLVSTLVLYLPPLFSFLYTFLPKEEYAKHSCKMRLEKEGSKQLQNLTEGNTGR